MLYLFLFLIPQAVRALKKFSPSGRGYFVDLYVKSAPPSSSILHFRRKSRNSGRESSLRSRLRAVSVLDSAVVAARESCELTLIPLGMRWRKELVTCKMWNRLC